MVDVFNDRRGSLLTVVVEQNGQLRYCTSLASRKHMSEIELNFHNLVFCKGPQIPCADKSSLLCESTNQADSDNRDPYFTTREKTE